MFNVKYSVSLLSLIPMFLGVNYPNASTGQLNDEGVSYDNGGECRAVSFSDPNDEKGMKDAMEKEERTKKAEEEKKEEARRKLEEMQQKQKEDNERAKSEVEAKYDNYSPQ